MCCTPNVTHTHTLAPTNVLLKKTLLEMNNEVIGYNNTHEVMCTTEDAENDAHVVFSIVA
jgi:hypothetical protein